MKFILFISLFIISCSSGQVVVESSSEDEFFIIGLEVPIDKKPKDKSPKAESDFEEKQDKTILKK